MIPNYKYENLTFSEALEYLKAGRALSRAAWNENEGWVNLYHSKLTICNDEITNETVLLRHRMIGDKNHSFREISLKVTDILADDWFLTDL